MRWFIVLLEFDFIVEMKKGTTHQTDLSCLTSGEPSKGVEDDLPNAYLFNIEMIPIWSEKYTPLMTIGKLDIPLPIKEKQALIHNLAPFVMLASEATKQETRASA